MSDTFDRSYRVRRYFITAYSPYPDNLQHKLFMLRCEYECFDCDTICYGLTKFYATRICTLLNNSIKGV